MTSISIKLQASKTASSVSFISFRDSSTDLGQPPHSQRDEEADGADALQALLVFHCTSHLKTPQAHGWWDLMGTQ